MSAEIAIQTAIYGVLSAALTVEVYSNGAVPDSTKSRYVVIGDDTHIEWSTDDDIGKESTITIHSWDNDSLTRGMFAIKTLMSSIESALNRAEFSVSGHTLHGCDSEFSETFVEADGVTRHGVQRFRILTTED